MSVSGLQFRLVETIDAKEFKNVGDFGPCEKPLLAKGRYAHGGLALAYGNNGAIYNWRRYKTLGLLRTGPMSLAVPPMFFAELLDAQSLLVQLGCKSPKSAVI